MCAAPAAAAAASSAGSCTQPSGTSSAAQYGTEARGEEAAAVQQPRNTAGDDFLSLSMTWSGRKYPIQVPAMLTVGELKSHIEELTSVLPMRQKLVGLAKGRLPADDALLASLALSPNRNFMMIGTAEHQIVRDWDPSLLPVVVNDLNPDGEDYFPTDLQSSVAENRIKLRSAIRSTRITPLNPVRRGKKLLVLDLDYTLFDCKSKANSIHELMRPGLHHLLSRAYPHYDICIWSQTAWKYLEMKITELGMLNNDNYKITFVMDITSMFSIVNPDRLKKGKPMRHQVKALDIIWSNFEGVYSRKNTLHVDDVSRNFAMNPQSGLKISAFKNAHKLRGQDRELYYLQYYLTHLAEKVDDFSILNHKNWKDFLVERIDPSSIIVPEQSASPTDALLDPSLGFYDHIPPSSVNGGNSWVKTNNDNILLAMRDVQGTEYDNLLETAQVTGSITTTMESPDSSTLLNKPEVKSSSSFAALVSSAPKYNLDSTALGESTPVNIYGSQKRGQYSNTCETVGIEGNSEFAESSSTRKDSGNAMEEESVSSIGSDSKEPNYALGKGQKTNQQMQSSDNIGSIDSPLLNSEKKEVSEAILVNQASSDSSSNSTMKGEQS